MNVKELIQILQKVDPKRKVIIKVNGGLEGYTPLADISKGAYIPDTTWDGEVWLEKLTEELKKEGYGEEDVAENGQPALILNPSN